MGQDGVDDRQSCRALAGRFGLKNRQQEKSKQYCADVVDLDRFLMSSGWTCVELKGANPSIEDRIIDVGELSVASASKRLNGAI